MKNRLLQLFNIRSNEAWLVSNLFWLQFFQGVGVAIFNTAAFALFLQEFDVKALPKVYIFSALLLWAAGYVYSKVEHAISIKTLVPLVILFLAGSILFLRIQFAISSAPIFLFLMFSWYFVIYLLSNLEFWGVAALLFDIRQSKRLFGMIGAGDIPAKLIGYSGVLVLVQYVSSENLLLLSCASMLCALIFYYRLRKAGKLDIHIEHQHEHHEQAATTDLRDIIKGFFGNRMIAMVAALSFIVVTIVTIVSFSFYAEIKHEAHSDEQLAAFIASFFAGGRILAIFVRLILTGRLTNFLGIKGSLLISPLLILPFLLGIIFMPFFSHNHLLIVYAFGLVAIITEVLKTSLQDPVFLTLMQPLSSSMRLKGHTIVKGVMDPFALFFTGFMLYSLLKLSGFQANLLVLLSYMLLALVVVWVVMIFMVDKEYVRTLLKALNRRYSVGQELNLSDEKTRNVLVDKIKSGERGEAIYILNILDRNFSEDTAGLVVSALQHPAQEVRLEALKMAERKKVAAALPEIENIIANKGYPELLPEAITAKCMLLPDELENLDVFLEDKDPRLVKAAIIGLMRSGGINAVVTAGQKLLLLIDSKIAGERAMAAEIIGELGVQTFFKPLLTLLRDDNEEVVKAAIVASGRVKNARLIPLLVDFFVGKKHEKLVVEALSASGDVALEPIKHILLSTYLTRRQQSKLILICGRIGSDEATKILDELIWKMPYARSEIFHALHLCEFKSQPHNRDQHLNLMTQYVQAGIRTLFMLKEIEKQDKARVLADALQLELNEIRDSLLLLFSFTFDKEKMLKAKTAFQQGRKEGIANALEVIEIKVPKEISLRFNHLFETGTVEEKCNSLAVYFKEELSYRQVVDEILHDRVYHYHRWTKAAALHSMIFYEMDEKISWLELAADNHDTLLRETAQKILAETVRS